jgi:uncharacterized protein (TIGR03437 family)
MPPIAGSGLAQASLISIFGSNLGPDPGVGAEFPLSNVLAGVSIEIRTTAGDTLPAVPLFVSSGQINALLPSVTPVGLNWLSVSRNGLSSGLAPLRVVRSSFGLFTSPWGAVKEAIAQRFVSEDELLLATQQSPARPGEIITLWGTGLGPASDTGTAGQQVDSVDTPIEVTVGNRVAEVLYQGRAPCCVGLDQLNLRIPDDVPLGCHVPVSVRVRSSVYSNVPTIPISADGSACREHPGVAPMLAGAPVGRLILRRAMDLDEALSPIQATTRDQAVGLFSTPPEVATPDGLPVPNTAAQSLLYAAGLPAPPPEGTCLVYSSLGNELVGIADAGQSVELQGPAGHGSVPWTGGDYRLQAPPEPLFLGPGDYNAAGPGGSGFPSFSARLSAGAPAEWTGKGDGEARVQGLSTEWAAPAPSPDSILLVGRGASPAAPGAGPEMLTQARFACAVSTTERDFVIPQAVLANLADTTLRLELNSMWGPQAFEFVTDGPESGSLVYLDARLASARLGQPHLPSTPVVLPDGTEVQAELAMTFAERQRGLMFRRELPAEQGMLFLFENPGRYGFWMLNTLVPLDIVWLDPERRVVFVSQNTPPCPAGTLCPTYGGDAVAQFVLELAAGQAAAHGLAVGGKLAW